MTLGLKLRALNAMNNSRLWFTLMTLGIEMRDLDSMNNSGFSMT